MNTYEITFSDGNNYKIKADEHLVINREDGSIVSWFSVNGEITVKTTEEPLSVIKQDCCDNCANGEECESKE